MSWIVGIHPVEEALAAGKPIAELWLQQGKGNPALRALLQQARARRIPIRFRPKQALDRIAAGAVHQGVAARVALVQRPDWRDWLRAFAPKPSSLLLALDGVTDPRNLGACARSAAAFGCDALLVPRDRSAHPDAPAAIKASAGALARLCVVIAPNLARLLRELAEKGVWIVGLSGDAERTIFDAKLDGASAIVVGGENKGLRPIVRRACDEVVRIPMRGAVESLNVSVAASIALFAAAAGRQQEACEESESSSA